MSDGQEENENERHLVNDEDTMSDVDEAKENDGLLSDDETVSVGPNADEPGSAGSG